jgi:hypothetical protein
MPTGVYDRKPVSDATKKKISIANKGKAPWSKGKHLSAEQKNNISKGQMNISKESYERRKESCRLLGKRPRTKKHLDNLSKSHIGKRMGAEHPNWKGGITPTVWKIRNSRDYRLWRTAVFERDNYTCVWCGKHGVYLEADHIKPFCDYPELRFAIDNGRTLCKECHKKTDNYGSKCKNAKKKAE